MIQLYCLLYSTWQRDVAMLGIDTQSIHPHTLDTQLAPAPMLKLLNTLKRMVSVNKKSIRIKGIFNHYYNLPHQRHLNNVPTLLILP